MSGCCRRMLLVLGLNLVACQTTETDQVGLRESVIVIPWLVNDAAKAVGPNRHLMVIPRVHRWRSWSSPIRIERLGPDDWITPLRDGRRLRWNVSLKVELAVSRLVDLAQSLAVDDTALRHYLLAYVEGGLSHQIAQTIEANWVTAESRQQQRQMIESRINQTLQQEAGLAVSIDWLTAQVIGSGAVETAVFGDRTLAMVERYAEERADRLRRSQEMIDQQQQDVARFEAETARQVEEQQRRAAVETDWMKRQAALLRESGGEKVLLWRLTEILSDKKILAGKRQAGESRTTPRGGEHGTERATDDHTP